MDNKKKRIEKGKGIFIAVILVISVFGVMSATVIAQDSKTLYVISDMGLYTGTTTLEAYAVDASGIGLTLVGSYSLPMIGAGAVGAALDDVNDKVFVSHEFSGNISVFDATNFNPIATIITPGSDIAGMTVDTATNTLYAIDRRMSTIYMYNTVTYASTGTGDISPVGAWGLAFDSANNHLYATDTSNIVHVYDASTFALITTYNIGNGATGIAVDFSDPANVTIYATDIFVYPPIGANFTKYETATGTITTVIPTGIPTGVTVDPDTGNAYITTARPVQGIEVYDTATLTLQNRVNLPEDWAPTDLFIGKVRFEPTPAPVPILTPIGIIALVGLLSVIAAISIRTTIRKKR